MRLFQAGLSSAGKRVALDGPLAMALDSGASFEAKRSIAPQYLTHPAPGGFAAGQPEYSPARGASRASTEELPRQKSTLLKGDEGFLETLKMHRNGRFIRTFGLLGLPFAATLKKC